MEFLKFLETPNGTGCFVIISFQKLFKNKKIDFLLFYVYAKPKTHNLKYLINTITSF